MRNQYSVFNNINYASQAATNSNVTNPSKVFFSQWILLYRNVHLRVPVHDIFYTEFFLCIDPVSGPSGGH